MTITVPSTGPTLAWGTAVTGVLNAQHTIYSAAPPAETGLSPLPASATVDATAIVQAHLDYVAATWGGGQVVVTKSGTPRTIKFLTGLTIPARVQLVSDESTIFDFTEMSTSGHAITVEDEEFTPMVGVWIAGPEDDGSVSGTSIGVHITGIRLRFYNCHVQWFGRGWDMAHDETWLVSVIGGSTHNCGTCVYVDNVAASADNAGEGMVLDHHTLFNAGRGFIATGNGVDFKMTNCSIDFCEEFGYISDAWVYLTACHLESQGGISGTYLFDVRGNSKVQFANVDVIMGEGTTGDLNYLFNHSEGPSNYGNGRASFTNTKIFCKSPAGADVTQWSEHMFEWPNDGSTTVVDMFTPFPLFWCPVSAHEVAQTFRNTGTSQATFGCSSPLGNLSFGDLRITASSFGYKMVQVRFG